jgi:peptidoglycan/LPS O-acetylase OafA/YrhL
LLVMARHYPPDRLPPWLLPAAAFGWSGVDLFFVLSGFLITRQLLSGMQMGEFYLRRALRILPPYWAALVLYFAVPGFAEQDGIAPLWKFVLFVQNIGLVVPTQGAFSHAWSLCIEEHFYLLLCPLLALGYKKNDTRWFLSVLGVALLGGALLRSALWAPEMVTDRSLFLTWIYYPTPTHLDGLVVGAALAALEKAGMLPRFPWFVPFAGGVLGVALGAWLTVDRQSLVAAVFGFPLVSFGYGLLAVAALRYRSPVGGTIAAAFAWLAYPAYLIHKPILHAAATLTPFATLNVLISFTLALLAASVVHLAVERPSLQLREHLIRRYHGQCERR